VATILSGNIQSLLNRAHESLKRENSEGFEALDNQFRQLGVLARETLQERLGGECRTLIDKLENGKPLTLPEQETLEMLIVGEARAFIQQESDYKNWQAKIEQLTREIEQLEASGLKTHQDLLNLQAVCSQARMILPGITYYLRERERAERFEASMRDELDASQGKFLADIIREMMQSGKM